MKKTFTILIAAIAAILMMAQPVKVIGQSTTVTYAQSSTSAASVTSGTAPTGSTVTFANTYANNKEQITASNSMTLTLTGYAGYKITGVTLSMHSNKSSGAGYLSVTAGSETLASIGSSSNYITFEDDDWNGEYSQSYVDIELSMSNGSYSIQNNENVVIYIYCSTKSLYCNAFTLTYESAGGTPTCVAPSFTITGVKKSGDTYYDVAHVALSSTTTGASIYYTLNGDAPTSSSTPYDAPFDITATKTIKAIAIKDGYNNSSVSEKTITIDNPTAVFTGGAYSESMGSSDSFGHMIKIDSLGNQSWTFNSTYSCAYINGYVSSSNHANKDWLITPKMEVTTDIFEIYFESYHNSYGSGQLSVKWSANISGPWTDLSFTEGASGGDFKNHTIRFSPTADHIYVAFVYVSTDSKSGQWEVRNFKAMQCYPVTYNNNGGSGEIVDSNSPYGATNKFTVKSSEGFTAPAESGKVFERWNTLSTGLGTSYMPDDEVTMGTSAVELFAIWATPCTEPAELGGTTITPTYVNDGGDKSYSLEFKSKVTALGGCDITDYGFVYSTSVASPAIGTANCNKQKIGEEYTTVNTEYTYNGITGVDVGVTYYVRSYAINAAGTTYGAVASITTEDFPTWTVTYNENGNTSHTQIIDRGDTEDLEEPANAAPANMTFAGWAEAEITKFATSAPAFVTEYEATDNKTFYAVYEYNCQTGETTKGWKRVDNASSLAKDDLLVIASETKGKVAGSTISSGYMNEATASFNNGIMTNLGNGAAQLTLGGSSGAWTLTNSSSQALGATAVKTVAWGSGTTTWSISITDGAATIQNGTSSNGRFLHNVNSTRFTTYTSDPNSAMLLPQLYRYEDIAATKSYYVTSVTELDAATTIAVSTTTTLNHNVTINTYGYTINGTLNADGYLIANKTASKIVVNNGGQLKVSNAVKATVKKNITQDWVPASGIGWYTISTPTGSTGFGDVANLKPMNGDNRLYDIYRYKESTMTWENSIEAGFDNDMFEEGRGYLYRKGNTSALEFAGPVNIAASYKQALTVTGETEIAGFALLGNPYSHNITLKHVTAAGNTFDECYVLTGEGAWTTKLSAEDDDEIAPCQGFLVQATTAGDAYIHKTAQSSKGRANADYIKFIVANNQYEDVTFALFDEGHGLNKINHRNSNIQQIYIPKDGESFAVATMADNTQSFDLNFKAMTMGQYTLSFKTKGEFNYLHVIDRMTGEDIDMLLEGEYSFIGSPQDNEARFIVRLGYLPNYDNNGADIFAYQNGSDVIVSGEGELQIFDVMGRMVSTQNVSGTETISVNAQGVYIFRLVGSEIKTQKIVVR